MNNRDALLTACAFAQVFLRDADAELRGASPEAREESQDCLLAALCNINETRNPMPYCDDAGVLRVRRIREEFDKERSTWH